MNFRFLALTAALLGSIAVDAATLSAREVAQLHSDIESMHNEFARGDTRQLLDKTHQAIYSLTGGKKSFEAFVREAAKQALSSGIKYISVELGTPTRTYAAGEEEVCFVPKIAVMEMEGKRRGKQTGFMIAIRKLGSDEWKYLDGSGLRKDPDQIYTLLPELERGIELPPMAMELL